MNITLSTKHSSLTPVVFGTAIAAATTLAMKVDCFVHQGDAIWNLPTQAKLQRACCYALALTLPVVIGGITLNPLLSLISLVGSAISVFFGFSILDYQDPQECLFMRKEAESLSFTELEKKHGLIHLSQLQIPNIQEKFAQSYAQSNLKQILQKYPLETIEQFHLSPLTLEGFLHDKFIETAREGKLEFIKNWKPDPQIYKIITEPMVQDLLLIQQRLKDLLQSLNISESVINKDPSEFKNSALILSGQIFALKRTLYSQEKLQIPSFKILDQPDSNLVDWSQSKLEEFNQKILSLEKDLDRILGCTGCDERDEGLNTNNSSLIISLIFTGVELAHLALCVWGARFALTLL
jgi:hypothetical protein